WVVGQLLAVDELEVRQLRDEPDEQHDDDRADPADTGVHRSACPARVAACPSAGAARAVSSDIRRRIASSAKLATSDDPPYETKGSGMPVSGVTGVAPPMIRNGWK